MQIFLLLCMVPFFLYMFRKIGKRFRCKEKTIGTLLYDEEQQESIIYYESAGREYMRRAGNTYKRKIYPSVSVRYNPSRPEESFVGKLDRAGISFSLFCIFILTIPLILLRLALQKNITYSTVLIVVESMGGALLVFASLGLLLMFFDTIGKLIRFREKTVGTVSSIESYRKSTTSQTGRQRMETYFYPVVEYEVDGVVYSVTSEVSSNIHMFRREEPVPIVYQASYPENAMIMSPKHIITLLFSLVLGFTAAFAFGGFLFYILWQNVLIHLL